LENIQREVPAIVIYALTHPLVFEPLSGPRTHFPKPPVDQVPLRWVHQVSLLKIGQSRVPLRWVPQVPTWIESNQVPLGLSPFKSHLDWVQSSPTWMRNLPKTPLKVWFVIPNSAAASLDQNCSFLLWESSQSQELFPTTSKHQNRYQHRCGLPYFGTQPLSE
jgi:hypothetical protein